MYPGLGRLDVVNTAIVHPGAVERYREALPSMKATFENAWPWMEAFDYSWDNGGDQTTLAPRRGLAYMAIRGRDSPRVVPVR